MFKVLYFFFYGFPQFGPESFERIEDQNKKSLKSNINKSVQYWTGQSCVIITRLKNRLSISSDISLAYSKLIDLFSIQPLLGHNEGDHGASPAPPRPAVHGNLPLLTSVRSSGLKPL